MAPPILPVVHLVGSVPLVSTEHVFGTLTTELAGRLQQIPDGETGDRGGFTAWQDGVLPPQIIERQWRPNQRSTLDLSFELTPDSIRDSGYDKAALQSYATFRQMRDDGKIPKGVRFQVSLPTPINVVGTRVHPHFAAQAEAIYEKRIIEALENIQDVIPAVDLAIQWDMALEMAHMEHTYGLQKDDSAMPLPYYHMLKPYYSPVKEGIAERAARLAAAVRPEVPMGYHFCYGDFGHQHFVQPKDTSLLVDTINAVTQSVSAHRSVQWIHLPVPKSRDDHAYYAPLSGLTMDNKTTIFLGLVHAGDEEGTQKRVVAAQKALLGRPFGVSTECGLGRTPVEDLDSIFHICREVTKEA